LFVIAFAAAKFDKTEIAIKPKCRHIIFGDFKHDPSHILAGTMLEKMLQKPFANTLSLPVRRNAN
jgi:hypothetical protein